MFINQYTMSDRLAGLFQEVINAAKEGRYCHGNGATWCIVEKTWDGTTRNAVIDTSVAGPDGQLGYKRYVATANPAAPHASDTTADNLEDFLDRYIGSVVSHSISEQEFGQLVYARNLSELLKEAVKAGEDGRCILFKDGQLHFKQINNQVRSVDFSTRGIVKVNDFGVLASRNYMKTGFDYASASAANEYWAKEAQDCYIKRDITVNA